MITPVLRTSIASAAIFCLLASTPGLAEDVVECAAEPSDTQIGYGSLISCAIDPAGDVDLFRFQGTAGESICVNVTDRSGSSSRSPCLTLLGPSGQATSFGANACTNVRDWLCGVLETTGEYTAVVKESDDDTFPYTLNLERSAPFASSNAQPMRHGENFAQSIDIGGDVDLFTFDGIIGDSIELRLTDRSGSSSRSGCLWVTGPEGETALDAVCANTVATAPLMIDKDGRYTAWIYESDDDSMPYTFDLQCLVGPCRAQVGLPTAWITGVPAFAAPGAVFEADASDSSDPDGTIETYQWGITGPCTANAGLTDVTFAFSLNMDAAITYPSTPCRLSLLVTDNSGRSDDAIFEVGVLPEAEETTMQEAYIAYYGRPADRAGLLYWGARLYQQGGNLDPLIAAYGTSAEYTQRFGALADAELIDLLYQNMFGRDAETAGRQWYIDQRLVPYRKQWTDSHGGNSAGATEFALSRIALDILNGAQNEDAAIIANKVAVARHFTEQVERWHAEYEVSDIAIAAAILRQVTADAATLGAARAEVDAAMPGL